MADVIKKPQGYKLIDTELTATSSNSSGDALFTKTSHGFTTGDYIYVKSESESYNGFKYVEVISVDTFKTREYPTADFTAYTRALTISYWSSSLTHGWQCAHLPIVYKISNIRWPINSVDPTRTVSSFSNDNGYTNLNLSGSLGAFNDLDWVEISGAATEAVNGVWQVIDQPTPGSDVTISLAYDSTYSFTGASVQYYHKNYQIQVRVYCGIPAGHEHAAFKPVELAAELLFTPDSDNTIEFSINEIVRSYLELKNNLTLDTLPNNIDFWTSFYISTAESFDVSDGTVIERFVSSYTVDSFTGYAVQAVLPFKNVQSGFLSDYVYSNTYLAQWLATQEEPVALVDKYFDLSFIKNIEGSVELVIQKMISGYAYATEIIPISYEDIGLFRVQITPDATYDYFCVYVQIPEITGLSIPELSEWTNEVVVGSNEPWTDLGTDNPFNDFNGEGGDSDFLVSTEVPDVVIGETYTFDYSFLIASTAATDMNMLVFLRHADGDYQLGTIYISSTGTISGSFDGYIDPLEVFNGPYYLILRKGVLTGESSVRVMYFTSETVLGMPITEEICIQILDVCDETINPDPDPTGEDIRLLEDGEYRLLE